MPSSVLLAILVGAGVLALLPALVRRYDTNARLEEEWNSASGRLLPRRQQTENTEPVTQPTEVSAEATTVRSTALARRRRRWLLVGLFLLVVGFVTAALLLTPLLWAGAGIGLLLCCGYVNKLRRAVRAEQWERTKARRLERALKQQRRRRDKAMAFARDIARTAQVDNEALAAVVRWLSAVPRARAKPPQMVVRVLRAADRQAYRTADGGWAVRKATVLPKGSDESVPVSPVIPLHEAPSASGNRPHDTDHERPHDLRAAG